MTKRRLVWLLWLLAVGGLYFFENNSGTRIVFAVSLLTPLSSALCALWCADRISFELTAPVSAKKGESFACGLRVSGSRLLAGCLPCCTLFVENPLTGDSFMSGLFSVDREQRIQLSSAYCGSLVIRFRSVAVEDRFGLFHFPLPERGTAEKRVIIYPELQDVTFEGRDGFEPGSGGSGGNSGNGADSSSWSGIRDYVPGDPVRQIHWKLSVKTDRLLIRELEGEDSEALLLWLETSLTKADPAAVDKSAEGLLSLSHSLCMGNVPHTAGWYDQERAVVERMAVRSPADHERMQEALLSAGAAVGGKTAGEEGIFSGEVIRFDPA